MKRRGVTLLELLIVIALLLGAAAIALPSLDRDLAERSFASTAETVEAQLLLARAQAMARGKPLEVHWSRIDSEIVIVEFDPRRDSLERADARSVGLLEGLDPGSSAWSDAMLENLIPLTDVAIDEANPSPVAAIRIPREHVLKQTLEMDGELDGAATLEDEIAFSLEPMEAESTRQSVRLAVYLADGSALLARQVWLVDEHDATRVVAIEVNPWTGLPRIERVEVMAEADSAPEAADPEFSLGEEEPPR
jgi:prepilin-type N-terminal cleavage/methylation domain-containing protein